MDKRYAASAVIYNDQGLVLLARRAPTKFPFPNVLSLPSTYIKGGSGELVLDLPEIEVEQGQLAEAVRKKLSLEIKIAGLIGSKSGQQENYHLTMTDYVARIEPNDQQIRPNREDFTEAQFYNPTELLQGKDRNKMGFCMQILLEEIDRNPDFWKHF